MCQTNTTLYCLLEIAVHCYQQQTAMSKHTWLCKGWQSCIKVVVSMYLQVLHGICRHELPVAVAILSSSRSSAEGRLHAALLQHLGQHAAVEGQGAGLDRALDQQPAQSQ